MGKIDLVGLCLGTILLGGGLGHVRKMEVEFLARPVECHVAEWKPRSRARKRSGSTRCSQWPTTRATLRPARSG